MAIDWMKEEQKKITDIQDKELSPKSIRRLQITCAAVAAGFIIGGTAEFVAILNYEKNYGDFKKYVAESGIDNSLVNVTVIGKDNKEYRLVGDRNEWLKEYSFYNPETKDYALLFPPEPGEEMYTDIITGKKVNFLDYGTYNRVDLPKMIEDGKVKVGLRKEGEQFLVNIYSTNIQNAMIDNIEDYPLLKNILKENINMD